MRLRFTIALLAVALAASCAPQDEERPSSSPPHLADGYEIVADQSVLPGQLESQAVLVSDPRDMPAVWDHYQLRGAPATFRRGREIAVFVGTGESGSCPIEVEDASVEGSDLAIRTADSDGPCTVDFSPRTFVFVFPARDAPAAGGSVTIQGVELEIHPTEAVVSNVEIMFPLQKPSYFHQIALRARPDPSEWGGAVLAT